MPVGALGGDNLQHNTNTSRLILRYMEPRTHRSWACFALTFLLLAGSGLGCSGSGRQVSASPEEAFNKGKALFEDEKYTQATLQLQSVFDFGRAHAFAADAQYMLAEAYHKNGEYLLAASEYDRFVQLYPSDERVEEAEYWRALSYYQLSPPYQLDQSDTERAITYLRLFNSRHPESDRVVDIGKKIDELQEKLARKLYEGGVLYEQQEQFEPAAITYERVLAKYPNTSYADDALVSAIRAYIAYSDASIAEKQAERLQKAMDTYTRLLQLFPDSNRLKEAEALYAQAQQRQAALANGG